MKIVMIVALLLLPVTTRADHALIKDGPVVSFEQAGAPAQPAFVCTSGNAYNANTVGFHFNHTGNESYAVLIDAAHCPTCERGFALTRVRTLLRADAGASFQISASIADAVDLGAGRYAPGIVQATSGTCLVSGITVTSGYYINLNWKSPCIESGRPYFLMFNFPDAGSGVVGPYVDNDGTTAGRVWRNGGQGWVDQSTALVGDVFLWAETDCCATPVGVDEESWGAVKSLFR